MPTVVRGDRARGWHAAWAAAVDGRDRLVGRRARRGATCARAAGRTACGGGARWPTVADRAGARPTRSSSRRRSPGCVTSRPGAEPGGSDARAAAAGWARLVHRRLLARPESDARRSSRPDSSALTRSTGSAPPRARRTRDRRLPRCGRPCVDHIGGSVNLIGDCQGGWLATIYAALRPERVNTLTIAGAPIDFHAGEPVIHAALRSLAPGGNLAFYRGLVAAGGGVLPRRAHARWVHRDQARERDRPPAAAAGEHRRSRPRRALPGVRGLVQAHPADPWRFLPLDRRASVPRQRADRRHARDRRRARRPRPDRVPAEPARRRDRPHHATRPGLRARRLRRHTARGRSFATRPPVATSACSWATRRCAITGRRCWLAVRATRAR